MSKISSLIEVEVDIVRLDSDPVIEHLQSSTAVLHDILSGGSECESNIGFPCQQCHKYYKTEKTLQSHYLLKHSDNNEEVMCTQCDKKYPSTLSLSKHLKYMHRHQHRCNACYRNFPTIETLKWHVEGRCVMTASPCAECGKTFMNQLALRNHIKYKHPEQSENVCNKCGRVFTSQRGLNNHHNTMHSFDVTTCTVCKRTFASRPALKSHLLYKHTEAKARCNFCHKAFTSTIRRDRHVKKFHKTNELNCICGICKNQFASSSDLLSHVMKTHTLNK